MTTVASLAVEITGDISGLDRAMNLADKRVRGFKDRVGKIGDGFSQAGRDLAMLTAPLIGLGVVGVRTAASFQSSMNEISARTGLVGDDLNRVRDFAMKMGADTAFSAQQAADAFLQLLSSGSSAEEAIGQLPEVLNLAAASGIDLGYAADLMTDVMKQFGVELVTFEDGTTSAGMVVDQLVRAAGSSSATVADLAQGFANVGPVANMFGMSVGETAAALATLAENGIKGSEGGTALKSMLLNLTRPTDKVRAALSKLGVSLYDTDGNFRGFDSVVDDLDFALDQLPMEEQIYYSQILAGSYGITAFNALRAAGGIDEMQASMLNATGAGDVAEARMQGFAGALEQLKGSFETLMIKAFTPFMDNFLTPMLNQITPIVNALGDWIADNPQLISDIGTLAIGGAILAGVMMLLGTAIKIATGPIGAMAVGIGAVALIINGMETGNLLSMAGGVAALGVAISLLMGAKFAPFGVILGGVALVVNGFQSERLYEIGLGIGAIAVGLGLAMGQGKLALFGVAIAGISFVLNGIDTGNLTDLAIGIGAVGLATSLAMGTGKMFLLGAALGGIALAVQGMKDNELEPIAIGIGILGTASFLAFGKIGLLAAVIMALVAAIEALEEKTAFLSEGFRAWTEDVPAQLADLAVNLGISQPHSSGFTNAEILDMTREGLVEIRPGEAVDFVVPVDPNFQLNDDVPPGYYRDAFTGEILKVVELNPIGPIEIKTPVNPFITDVLFDIPPDVTVRETLLSYLMRLPISFDVLSTIVPVIANAAQVIDSIRNFLSSQAISATVNALVSVNPVLAGAQGVLNNIGGAANTLMDAATQGAGPLPDGAGRGGIGYVPYDGYMARLHRGEQVLTENEARGRGSQPIVVNVTAYGTNEQEFAELVRRAMAGMAR